MSQILQYDGVDLMSDPYIIRNLPHDSWPTRKWETQQFTRESGVAVLDYQFAEKSFTINGKITGTSKENLEANIDSAKELFSRTLKNLDIGYSSGTRRYKAYVNKFDASQRDFFHLLFVPFTAEFIIPSGFGIDATISNSLIEDVTTTPYNGTLTIAGTFPPKPKITITINSGTSITGLSFMVNGDKINITQALTSNDIIVIDCNVKKVTFNGVEIDYAGLFPRFLIGSNSYQIVMSSSARNYDISIDYNPTYL